MQCPRQSEEVMKIVILKGRIFPAILTNNNSLLAEFPYMSNFVNGLNTSGTNARLSWYYNWGDVTVLTEASHTYPKQFRRLTCFLWDSNISKGTTLSSTKASYTLNNSSRAVTLSIYISVLPKRHCYVTAEIHRLPFTLRRLLWNNSTSNQCNYHLNTKREKKTTTEAK